jgi:tetratricopeptide (TPR) repeat protein
MNGAVGVLVMLSAGAASAGGDEDARAGAWDRSVSLQVAADLGGAEALMLRAWGSNPENYWVSLRLAYLALLQGRAEEAASRYQALRTRPEAEGDTDVVRGHASAIAAVGWQLAQQGSPSAAREHFRRALAIDPENQSATQGLRGESAAPIVSPEAWAGYFEQSLGTFRYRGWLLYGSLPVRVGDLFEARVTGRYLSASRDSRRSPWGFGNQGAAPWTLDEQYLSLARERAFLGGEVVGLRSGTTGRAAIWGGAGRLRVGSAWGGVLEAAYLRASGVATNLQARPTLFYWPWPELGLQAGARLTKDERGNSASAAAGLSLLLHPVALHVRGHLGVERWAFAFEGPSLASFDTETSYGGSAMLRWSPSTRLRLSVLGEGERLRDAGVLGFFWSISAGLQYLFGPE